MPGGDTLRGERVRARSRRDRIEAADLAWMLLLPTVAVAVPTIALLAPIAGRLLLPDPDYSYWVGPGVRKPAVHVGYAMFVLFAAAYAAAIVRFTGIGMSSVARRALIVLAQAATVAFLVVCLVAQQRLTFDGVPRRYFTPATLSVAGGAAVVAMGALAWWRRRSSGRASLRLPRSAEGRAVRLACVGLAALATVVFVLPAVHTDSATPSGEAYLGALFFDEATAVLNGRSTFVEMVAYGNLWPYVALLPLRVFGGTYAAFTVTMASLTALAMLAVYGVLRRIVRRPLLALALYLPVLATGFFLETQIGDDRYDPGTYFGMFPLRYAGPYLLAWLTAWQLGRDSGERWTRRLLFAAGGLVALNNVDFGGAALAATVVACVVHWLPRTRRAIASFAFDVAIGLAASLAAVTVLTLAREGSLPHLQLLVRYGRGFVNGGFANLPTPALGLHLVLSATFVAAGAVAAARASRLRGGDLLASMLAWCALFGLGASVYYYAYRSHPNVLVNLFSIWSLTLALLVIAAVREAARSRNLPGVPALAVTFGFALAVCSLAQVPNPFDQVRRIEGITLPTPGAVPPGGFREAAVSALVARRTRPGEAVAVISPLGHRVAREAGIVNVAPYTGFEQMPAREQLEETVAILEREGGTTVFVAQLPPPGFEVELMRLGFRLTGRWSVEAWPEPTVSEYRTSGPA
jgi:hypothetical protein